jgi:hypothetical protein
MSVKGDEPEAWCICLEGPHNKPLVFGLVMTFNLQSAGVSPYNSVQFLRSIAKLQECVGRSRM